MAITSTHVFPEDRITWKSNSPADGGPFPNGEFVVPLDFPDLRINETPMKTLFCTALLLFSLLRTDAALFELDGKLTWEVTEPRCTFRLDGVIPYYGDVQSGTVKLVLWAAPAPFPTRGTVVAEYTLGQISSGSQFDAFTVKTTSNIPNLSGIYYFTIGLLEYTTAGWKVQLAGSSTARTLQNGNFENQKKWKIPSGAIIAPPATLKKGNLLKLTLKATEEFNRFPLKSQERTTIDVLTKTKGTAENPFWESPANYTYQVKKGLLKSKSVSSGRLLMKYSASAKNPNVSSSELTLYFQSKDSGFYKNSEESFMGTEVTWGTFTFK